MANELDYLLRRFDEMKLKFPLSGFWQFKRWIDKY